MTILKKEKAEYEHLRTPIKEIKHDFTAFDNEVEESKIEVDYLSNANYDESIAQKKYFNEEKAVKFIEFIFKKYAVTVTSENGEDKFASEVLSKILEGSLLNNAFAILLNNPSDLQNCTIIPQTTTKEIKCGK